LSRVLPFLAFGMTMIVGGMYWMLWDDSRSYLDFLVVNDAYYELAYFLWRMIPIMLLIVGIIFLIVAGVNASKKEVISY